MEETVRLKHTVGDLLKGQNLAVLSTHHKGQPYASLVVFAATEDIKQILFATTRATRKYDNIVQDPRVALLIDSRTNLNSDIHGAIAVTVTGRAEEVKDKDKEAFLKIYLAKHPHLKDFVRSPTCALLRVKVEAYYMVSKFQKVIELHLSK
jgi:nitroimidazol reductase NimA-like FMN-containing flavoprotein (pyridoxamine 5'-phosphate oxidase superfamily)